MAEELAQEDSMPCYVAYNADGASSVQAKHEWGEPKGKRRRSKKAAPAAGPTVADDACAEDTRTTTSGSGTAGSDGKSGEGPTIGEAPVTRLDRLEQCGSLGLQRVEPNRGSVVFVRADSVHTLSPPSLLRPLIASRKRERILFHSDLHRRVARVEQCLNLRESSADLKAVRRPNSDAVKTLQATPNSEEEQRQQRAALRPPVGCWVDVGAKARRTRSDRAALHRP